MKTSIILLSYNQVDYTRACIESIKMYTKPDTFEIIVVDNNSSKSTIDQLEEISDIILIKNSFNRGFPGGCNDGIRVATGDNILLLNNDTIVTENWLDNMLKALYSSDSIGAVGPVTNNCSNFQSIPCNYSSIDEMFEFAKEYNKSDPSEWHEWPRLIGYAFLMKKKVLDEVGLLDESFFPGNYEDDDLSLRIRAAGYKLLLCKDTFIHHFSGTSFSSEGNDRFRKTILINQSKYMNKYNLSQKEIEDISLANIDKVKNILSRLDRNKETVSFIFAVNDEEKYLDACSYINRLFIPPNIDIEIVPLRNEKNIFEAYNKGMHIAKGKYKVYMHQDVQIVNPNFINDLLFNFNLDDKIGMIGMVGAQKLNTRAIWWESPPLFGETIDSHTGTIAPLKFNDPVGLYQEVEAIDGFIMATQYDIPWRQDIFDGWHFYDISQSMEFILNGYKVIVPIQISPWTIHDCGVVSVNGYEEARAKFLKEYWDKVEDLPLVSIVIPTYNRPEFLRVALESALAQTYRNKEIIVCDDSSDNRTEELLKKYPNVKYVKNETNLGHTKNYKQCFDLAKGEFIAFLMDDDVFHNQKIEIMVNTFLQNPTANISIVTSKRSLIDENGNLLPDTFNTAIVNQSSLINGIEAGDLMLKNINNFIGEPTTPLFKKSDVDDIFKLKDREYNVCSDMVTWLQLLRKGNLVYIVEPLSLFRQHKEQGQNSSKNVIIGGIELAHQVLNARELGFLLKESDFNTAINNLNHRLEAIYLEHSKEINSNYLEFLDFYNEIKKLVKTV